MKARFYIGHNKGSRMIFKSADTPTRDTVTPRRSYSNLQVQP